jgi:putative restriction endonuclease
MDFESTYGFFGAGFIHVHHNKPVSETGPTRINPEVDMSVVCPNCHAMIHRKRDRTLTVSEVRDLLSKRPNKEMRLTALDRKGPA